MQVVYSYTGYCTPQKVSRQAPNNVELFFHMTVFLTTGEIAPHTTPDKCNIKPTAKLDVTEDLPLTFYFSIF